MKKKKNTIVIDLDLWVTQKEKAKQYKNGSGCSPEYICKLINKGKLKTWKIDELGLHLVER